MTDAFDRVLELVASGRLTAQEAAPLLDALDQQTGAPASDPAPTLEARSDEPASAVRIELTEAGRKVVNLRIPLALGRSAINHVPGLSQATSDRIREAITAGLRGPILDVEDDEGDGVRVVIE
jgi:hypothetical protein